ncbi:MAG TPA: CHAT domain-containing tetratricopeptide repeat protein [Bryobacteraceae bacterium]|nr:CHAT domain-containing tetratricopeptide repeat protein [Bryobacteraceae bacterium]
MAHIMDLQRVILLFGALLCASAQTSTPGASSAERASRLMEQANKLAEQRTGTAMEQAIAQYREAVPLWHELQQRPMEAKALAQIGALSIRLGNLQPALESLNAALPIIREIGDKNMEQVTLNNIGLVQSRLGNQRLAIETEQQALRLAQETGDRTEEAVVLNNLGLAYHELGEEQHAIEQFEKALQIQHETGNLANEGAAWSNLGAIHYTQGDLQESLDAFERALELRKNGGDRRGQANTMGKIAVVRHALGQDEEALAAFEAALQMDREVGDHLEESTATMNKGNVYMAQGRYPLAVAAFDEGMHIQEKWGKSKDWGNEMSFKAVALTAMGKYEEAHNTFSVALAAQRSIGNRRGESESLARLAALEIVEGHPVEGASHAAESAQIAETIGEKRTRAEAMYQLSRCEEARGRSSEALNAINESLRVAEGVREGVSDYDLRASYFSRVRDRYDLKVKLLVETGDIAAAFETAEMSRARSLYDLLRNRLSPGQAPETGRVPLAELESQLDSHTVAIEYSLGSDASYAFVIKSDGVSATRLEDRSHIEAAARRLYAKWSTHQDSPADSSALSRMVLAPIRNAIGKDRVVVVPDGALAYIPFDALFLAPERRLIEDHDVVTVVSLSSLKLIRDRIRNRTPAAKLVAVFADPVFNRNDPRVESGGQRTPVANRNVELERSASDVGLTNLDRLVSTRREAAAIAALAPEKLRWESLDFNAALTAVRDPRLSDYRIIHFATHGLMNSRDPHLSGLVFSLVDRKGQPQTGFLRADEVSNLKLGADLVVLSACQTALGKELRGEGLLGLSRGFMYAGAPRVIASLWRVADAATAKLMSTFYEALLSDRVPAAEALRRAKLRLMRDSLHSSPYYWAAFTLQGDWR